MEKLTIEAGRAERHYWKDLWHFRELLYFLSWRDILVRYKQTAVGVAWAVIRPLVTMIILAVTFGKLAKMPSCGVPYPVLVFSAMLPWQLFSNSFSDSGNSIVANSSLISKIYFPRLIVPASTVVVGLVDFLISVLLLAVMMVWYRFLPDWRLYALPFFVLLAVATSLGAGILIAALTVAYRDFRYVVPFVVQLGLLISPVGFSSTVIPERWRLLYAMNPMVGVIDGFRWSLLRGQSGLDIRALCLSGFVGISGLALGISYFRKTERTFADII